MYVSTYYQYNQKMNQADPFMQGTTLAGSPEFWRSRVAHQRDDMLREARGRVQDIVKEEYERTYILTLKETGDEWQAQQVAKERAQRRMHSEWQAAQGRIEGQLKGEPQRLLEQYSKPIFSERPYTAPTTPTTPSYEPYKAPPMSELRAAPTFEMPVYKPMPTYQPMEIPRYYGGYGSYRQRV